MGFQQGLFNTQKENDLDYDRHVSQMSFLPVSPLQEKHIESTPELTQVEFQIMDMTVKGYEITEIAMQIHRSIACVKWRLSQIYGKFYSKNRLQFIKKASTKGIQFYLESGVKMSFHMKLDMMAHNKDVKIENI